MFKKIVIASAVLIAAMSANAQSTVTLGGTINPPSCDLVMTTSKAVYGDMSANTIKGYTPILIGGLNYYKLSAKKIDYTLKCDAPVKVELAFSDSNAGKASYSSTGSEWAVVDASGTSVGYAVLDSTSYTLNSNAVAVPVGVVVAAPVGTTTWGTTFGTGGLFSAAYVAPGYAFGFSPFVNSTVPNQVSAIDGAFNITPFLKKSYVDAATSIFSIALSGTITLQYL